MTSDDDACPLDGTGPHPVLHPESVEDLSNIVLKARSEGEALFPKGGGTMLHIGFPPDRSGKIVDLRKVSEIQDFPARDMTVTVGAGIAIAELDQQIRAENLRLPIDIPYPDQATLGGAIALNVSGFRRYGFGTLRDYVIGIHTMNDQGQEVKAGGRVVKNVAGYDLCKLHTGAMGTLGIITAVTLKLRPVSEDSAMVSFSCSTTELENLLDHLSHSSTRPVCMDLFNANAAVDVATLDGMALPKGEWTMVLGFEESEEAVQWQIQQLIRELSELGYTGLDARAGGADQSLQQILRDFPLQDDDLVFKVNLVPHALPHLCQWLQTSPVPVKAHAHAGTGILRGHVSDITLEQAKNLLDGIQKFAAEAHGNVTVQRCPSAWKATLPVWGAKRGDAVWMRSVKEKLDPQRLFNPGRFLDGL